MSQKHESRYSDNPYIERVWHTVNLTDGVYLATPDAAWDLIVGIDTDGSRSVMLAGQATKPAYVPYKAGTEGVVISFVPGAYLPHLSGDKLLDSTMMLPKTDDDHFELAGHRFAIPMYETAEIIVEELAGKGMLVMDEVVDSVLNGQPKAISARAAQRHFVKVTGTTRKQLEQIQRAQEAVRLLQKGARPIDAATAAGYTDQPHFAKSLKRIMDSKPSDVDDIHKL